MTENLTDVALKKWKIDPLCLESFVSRLSLCHAFKILLPLKLIQNRQGFMGKELLLATTMLGLCLKILILIRKLNLSFRN